MKMKILIAMTAALVMASSSMAGWFHEDFESYADEAAWLAAWPRISGSSDLAWFPTGGWEGPKHVGGAKTPRRHEHDLLPYIQAAPGGAGMTLVNGTDPKPVVMEVAYQFRDTLEIAQTQAFYFHLSKGSNGPPRRPDTNPHSALGFGAFPTYDGTASRVGLMYYDGLNWTELTTLKHATGWNFIRAIIKETTVSLMYWDEFMSNGMQTAMVNREYLGGFDTMGKSSDTCVAMMSGSDAYDLDGGVFVPEPATVLLLSLGGLVSMRSGLRRRRVATGPACGG